MTEGYSQIVVISLLFLLAPAIGLSWKLRPKSLSTLLRGGEFAITLGMAIYFAKTLALVAGPTSVFYPGDFWAIFNVAFLGASALLFWSRLSQLIRHDARNRRQKELLSRELKAQGVDVNKILKKEAENGGI